MAVFKSSLVTSAKRIWFAAMGKKKRRNSTNTRRSFFVKRLSGHRREARGCG